MTAQMQHASSGRARKKAREGERAMIRLRKDAEGYQVQPCEACGRARFKTVEIGRSWRCRHCGLLREREEGHE